eukprot:17681-Heterococcus_DN1.PRE.4
MYTVPMTSELVHAVSRMFMSPPPPPSLPAPTSTTATTAATTTATTAATGANAASTATAAGAATGAADTGAASTADAAENTVDNTVVGSKSVASYLPHSVKLPQKLAKRGAPVPITVQLGPHFDAAAVLRQTILNPSQVAALEHALSHRVALIEGPPGTGKTFIGALLAQIIVANTKEQIVIVCLKNHALDQILEQLLDAGVTDLVRIDRHYECGACLKDVLVSYFVVSPHKLHSVRDRQYKLSLHTPTASIAVERSSESVRLIPYNLHMLERRSQHDSTFAREYADTRAQHIESAQAIARLTARVTGNSTANTTNTATATAAIATGVTGATAAATSSGSGSELSWQELYENYDDRYTLGESQLILDPADRLDALTVPADLSGQF